jgi:hypothetical protein
MLRLCVQQKANLNLPNKGGNTALCLAAYKAR